MPRSLVLLVLAGLAAPVAANAQEMPSLCHAIADALPKARFVSVKAAPVARLAQRDAGEVSITFVNHSTYRIESPDGVSVETDYSGYGSGPAPRVATMNKAHSTHYTDRPDPAIEQVLRGWNPEGGPARHRVTVDDVYIRNVTSDIRTSGGAMEKDGNSIFVFETAGLCIGHLGHLHQKLTDAQFAEIGRLDVVMVPVDGSWTMSQEGMAEMVRRFRSRAVLPMHNFRGRMDRFLAGLPDFAVERLAGPTYTVSLRSLPRRPTVILLDGV